MGLIVYYNLYVLLSICFLFIYPDERFPSDATVEFVFSSGPEKIKGYFSLHQILHNIFSASKDLFISINKIWEYY